MYQTINYRPPPLELSLPSAQGHYNIDKWRDFSTASLASIYPSVSRSKDDLQPPPADDMSTVYSVPQMNSYFLRDTGISGTNRPVDEGVQLDSSMSNREVLMTNLAQANHPEAYEDSYPNAITHFGAAPLLPPQSSVGDMMYTLDETHHQYSQPQEQHRRHRQAKSQQPQKQRQPSSRNKGVSNSTPRAKLQIPNTISLEGGSLSDFAAQITCLFWFESIDTLNEAEGLVPASIVRILRPEAMPSFAFKKWVATILSTTQVTDKVIILALLFIYRLKIYNSGVQGRSGSEYRLLTVALMLGNKFLDDNTYTNNTWAEVSGISVHEIHIMEVEFLSNMRYSLVASEEQWDEWHRKLAKFKQYCDAAIRAATISHPLPPMPSPPESTRASPPPNHFSYSPSHADRKCLTCTSATTPSSALRQLAYFQRKRSLDLDMEMTASKKMVHQGGNQNTSFALNSSAGMPDLSRMLSIAAQPSSSGLNRKVNGPGNKLISSGSTNLTLPPLGSLCSSAMSAPTVTTPSMNPRTSSNNYALNNAHPSTPIWTSQFTYSTASGHNVSTPSQRVSPLNNHSSGQDMMNFNPSPISANSYSSNGERISPSILHQRPCPYEPIRHVNTLLCPTSVAATLVNSVNQSGMKFRTLGMSNQNIRTGVVPHLPTHW